MAESIFGVKGTPGMLFATSFGYIGNMVLLSNGSLLLAVLQGGWIGFLLFVCEKNMTFLIRNLSGKTAVLLCWIMHMGITNLLWILDGFFITYVLILSSTISVIALKWWKLHRKWM